MKNLLSKRMVNIAGALVCAGLLAYAYVLQFVSDLEPCPLCIFQRLAFFALGVVFALAAIHAPAKVGARIYAAAIGLAAVLGAGIAGRHVWLQNLPPDQVPECGPGLDYMLDAFPLAETLKLVLTGSGECAEIAWRFLGMSIPAWALLWFVALGLAGVVRNLMSDSA